MKTRLLAPALVQRWADPPRAGRTALTQRFEELPFLLPRLTLRWRITDDDVAAGGPARWPRAEAYPDLAAALREHKRRR